MLTFALSILALRLGLLDAGSTRLACDVSRHGRVAIKSAYNERMLSKVELGEDAGQLGGNVFGPAPFGINDSSGVEYEIYGRDPYGIHLVVATDQDVLVTTAIGVSSAERAYDVGDPKGILLGDSKACVLALAGQPNASNDEIMFYDATNHIRKFYGVGPNGRIIWIGRTFGPTRLPNLAHQAVWQQLFPVMWILLIVIIPFAAIRMIGTTLVYVSSFDYAIQNQHAIVTQRLFGAVVVHRLRVPLDRVTSIEVLRGSYLYPGGIFSVAPWHNIWGNSVGKKEAVRLKYLWHNVKVTAVLYPKDADHFARSISSLIAPTPVSAGSTPGGKTWAILLILLGIALFVIVVGIRASVNH
jgi:hypothetical protein